MRITRIEIKNFRSIRHLVVDLGETTVFVGPNNSGKTAILDALRIALTRRWGQRGTGFTEYDIHLKNDSDDPKTSDGVSIEIRTEESKPKEWPDAVVQATNQIVQLDPATGRRTIDLRAKCSWSEESRAFEPSWEFLNAAREPLAGRRARRINLEQFWRYLPVFYLGALRDVGDEFSSRSQFWGRLLRAMEIPASLEWQAQLSLDYINNRLLKADPRLEEIAETLSVTTKVAARDRAGSLTLRMAPLKTWDLLSKAEIILRNEPDRPWLPLQRQGQGIQSLSVIFLFQAFVKHLLNEVYEQHSEPVLALEEPETHLHPQAARTLWEHVRMLPGQKIITTHSPYFVQHVPFRDLRLVRLTDKGTEVRSLPTSFSTTLPTIDGVESVVNKSEGLLIYNKVSNRLTVNGSLDRRNYRDLLFCCGSHENRTELEQTLRNLRNQSSTYIDDETLQSLETFARRMRGEIFFAERWLIVEGQADYLIVHALAHAINYSLDEHGVSVIDAQNNGSPDKFAMLARALNIPWLAVFDGDDSGKDFIQRIRNRGFDTKEVGERCFLHKDGDLESQLVADGLETQLREILTELEITGVSTLTKEDLIINLRKNKTAYAAALAARLRADPILVPYMPKAFLEAITKLWGLK